MCQLGDGKTFAESLVMQQTLAVAQEVEQVDHDLEDQQLL